MSLSASEVRTLSRIERALLSRDPRLRSLFSIFTRLTWQEAMPAREQIRRRAWRPKPGIVILVAIALAVGVIIVSSVNSVQRACAPSRGGVAIARTADRGCAARPTSAAPPTR
jgi:anti-sigma-K factor RskA